MAEKKRDREETAIDAAVTELDASLGRDADIKLKAIATLIGVVDATDEGYTVQRQAADNGALTILMRLLEDDTDAVRIEAAKALTVLTQHSPTVIDRMKVGQTQGFSQTPEKVSLNPVQESVDELDGVFNILTNMRFSDNPDLQLAGSAALTAVCSLNRPNTLAALRELVHRLLQHEAKALLALEDMIAGVDVRDDMAVLLDQALNPTLSFLRNGADSEKLDAVMLLGSICEKRPGAAAFLVAEGALTAVTQMLVSGDIAATDAAARTLWLLVKDNKKLLSPDKDALGVAGLELVKPLVAVVEVAEEQDKAADKEPDSSEEESDEGDGDKVIKDAPTKVAVDNGDDALLLLRTLAAQDPDAKEELKKHRDVFDTRCVVM